MISLSIFADLYRHESRVDLVTGIGLPRSWDEVEGAWLLRAIERYEDAVFNYHLIEDLIAEVDLWRGVEAGRGAPDAVLQKLAEVRRALSGALERRDYAAFLGD